MAVTERTIHPTAVVDPSAELGRVRIGPYAVVGPRVVLHDDVVLDAHAVVLGPTVLGSGCRVHAFACLGGDPQDLKYRGETTRLEVGPRNTFRENVTVSRGTAHGGGVTRIGADNLFMASSHVAHDCVVGDGCVMANCASLAGHVEVGDGAVIGGLVGVHQHVRVGRLAMLGGGAMVAQDVPPFMLVQGDRARLHGLNVIGLRRAGVASEALRALRRAYRELFQRGRPLRIAIEEVERQEPDVPEVRELLAFLRGSTRGICRPASEGGAG